MKLNKKGDLVSLAIGAAIAVVLLSIVWSLQVTATHSSTINVNNESFTGVNGTWVDLDNDGIINSTTVVANQTATAFVNPVNYTIDAVNGRINLFSNMGVLNSGLYNITYNYTNDSYITSPIARLVVGFIVILLAVGIVIALVKGRED